MYIVCNNEDRKLHVVMTDGSLPSKLHDIMSTLYYLGYSSVHLYGSNHLITWGVILTSKKGGGTNICSKQEEILFSYYHKDYLNKCYKQYNCSKKQFKLDWVYQFKS